MTIAVSYERFMFPGPAHRTEVWTPAEIGGEGKWMRLSGAFYPSERVDYDRGFKIYILELLEGEKVRAYHRSNTGIERVDEGRVAGPEGTSITLDEGETIVKRDFAWKF